MNDKLIAGGRPGWMVVRIGDARAALPIESVGEVLPVPAMSPVPMAPHWVAGIVSVRGDVVTVVDAGRRLHGRAVGTEAQLVLIATDDAAETVGLLVDAVAGLIERTGAQLTDADGTETDLPAHFTARRVSNGSTNRVAVLDLDALLDPAIESV